MNWIRVNERLPKEGQENLLVWCGWPHTAQYYPSKNKDKPWFSEPALINPIFSVPHWAVISPPTN